MEVRVLENILAANESLAKENATLLKENGVFTIDLMASPGAGKTSFIVRTIEALKDEVNIAVIEGDIASKVDAERVQGLGVEAIQINTGGACHLDANMVKNALSVMDLSSVDLLIIENVGNLVCPAGFNLGQDVKAMILSVPEGDDKPLKYPMMFSECSVLVINKIDLLELSDFSIDRVKQATAGLNPDLNIFPLSCKTGEGLDDWVEWVRGRVAKES